MAALLSEYIVIDCPATVDLSSHSAAFMIAKSSARKTLPSSGSLILIFIKSIRNPMHTFFFSFELSVKIFTFNWKKVFASKTNRMRSNNANHVKKFIRKVTD